MIKNKCVSLVYKTILITISFMAIYTMIININPSTFAYFTNLSNVLVFVIMLIVWINTIKDVCCHKKYNEANKHLVRIKGVATLCIMVTGLVYAFLLADYSKKSNYTVQNLSVHYIIPLMTILDYFLFDEKGLIKWYHPIIWVFSALLYLPFIFIRALILTPNTTQVKYPYFFIDVDKLGVGGVAIWCIILVVVFSILAYLIYLYDRLSYKKLTK